MPIIGSIANSTRNEPPPPREYTENVPGHKCRTGPAHGSRHEMVAAMDKVGVDGRDLHFPFCMIQLQRELRRRGGKGHPVISAL